MLIAGRVYVIIISEFLCYGDILNNSTDTYVEQNSNKKVKEIHERIKVLKKNRAVEDRYMHYLYVDKIIEEQENALKRMEEELESKKKALEKTEDDLKKVENAIREAENATREAENATREAENATREAEEAAREAENVAREAENVAREAEEAAKEMIFDAMEYFGDIPEPVCKRIRNENNINILKFIHKIALKAESIKQFEEQIANL